MTEDNDRPLKVFENSHSMPLMVYIFRHEGCTKTQMYDSVSWNCRMPDKIKDLEKAGLIRTVAYGRSTRLFLTDVGRDVGYHLSEIYDIMTKI